MCSPITSATPAVPASPDVAGAAGGGPVQQDPPSKVIQGGGECDTPPPLPATPTASTSAAVAGASGGGDVPAAVAGVSSLPGAADLAPQLQAIIATLNELIAKLGGVSGGGAPGQAPGQAPGKPPLKEPSDVAGDKGGPVQQDPGGKPGQVGGEHGHGKTRKRGKGHKPHQGKDDDKPGGKPGQVGGQHGPPTQDPPVKAPPTKVPPVKNPPSDVGGANGGPGQVPGQGPIQGPVQNPPDKPDGPTPPAAGGGKVDIVKLSNDDDRFKVRLYSSDGNSVSIYGDPHVKVKIDGKTTQFDIGYGPGKIRLSDGSVVKWDTYDKGKKIDGDKAQFRLRTFTINSAGTKFDQTVKMNDGKEPTGLRTALTDDLLQEFIAKLSNYAGSPTKPLKKNGK